MMKKFLVFLLPLLFISCEIESGYDDPITGTNYPSYDAYCDYKINSLKAPVILIGIGVSTFDNRGITIMDNEGTIVTFGNLSSLANNIANSHKVGDTIKSK